MRTENGRGGEYVEIENIPTTLRSFILGAVILVHHVRLTLVTPVFHTGVLVCDLDALLAIQCPANALERHQKMVQVWEIWMEFLLPALAGPIPSCVAIWGEKQLIEDIYFCLSLSMSAPLSLSSSIFQANFLKNLLKSFILKRIGEMRNKWKGIYGHSEIFFFFVFK